MKRFLISILLLLTCCKSTSDLRFESPKTYFSDQYDSHLSEIEFESVVRISSLCQDGTMYGGTGVAIDKEHVLTAKHVVTCDMKDPEHPDKIITAPAMYILIYTRHEEKLMAVIEKYSDDNIDAVKLYVSGYLDTWAPVNADKVKIGENLCAVTAIGQVKKCGYVFDIPLSSKKLLLGLRALHGDSGSPLYNEKGEVVGLVTMLNWSENNEDWLIGVSSFAWKSLL